MTRRIEPHRLSKSKRIGIKSIPGARVEDVSDLATKIASDRNAEEVILHLGSNNIGDTDAEEKAIQVESLGMHIMEKCDKVSQITISGIIQRSHSSNHSKTNVVNHHLKQLQIKHGWKFIDNSNITPTQHISYDGVHLNGSGVKILAKNLINHLSPVVRKGSMGNANRPSPSHPHPSSTNPGETESKAYRHDNESLYSQITQDNQHRPLSEHQRHPQSYSGCYNCGELNHNKQHCRHSTRLQCNSCLVFGHKSKLCPYSH